MSDQQSQPISSKIGEVVNNLTALMSELQVEESSVSAETARADLKQAFIDRFLNLLNTSSLEDLENMKVRSLTLRFILVYFEISN